jgi:methionyl-tRNA formyltransferase
VKILFMGTPGPAAKCLQALIDAKENVVAVITQPDRPKGRGLKVTQSAVKELALTYNIPVHQPEKIKDKAAIELVKNIAPDLIVVVAYGKILPKEIIDAPKYGSINVHASLLPKYRGAAPIQWALINGDKMTGITIQKVAEALDSGDIILQEKINIDDDDNIKTLASKLFDIGSKLLIKAVGMIKSGNVSYTEQDERAVTLAPQLNKSTGEIKWDKSAKEIFDLIRGCDPWPVAYTYFNGKMFKIFSSAIGIAEKEHKPGEVVEIAKDEGFIIGCRKGSLLIREVQLEGSRKMDAWQFMLGHKINCGDIFPS